MSSGKHRNCRPEHSCVDKAPGSEQQALWSQHEEFQRPSLDTYEFLPPTQVAFGAPPLQTKSVSADIDLHGVTALSPRHRYAGRSRD